MKLFLLAAATLLAAGWIAPREAFAPTRQDAGEERAHEESVLEERMHVIEHQIKALRRSLRDPAQKSNSFASLATLQTAAVAAKSEPPRMLARVPAADQAKFLDDYRREMVGLLEASLKVERALLDGKQEEALVAFEALRAMEDPSHAKFTDEEK